MTERFGEQPAGERQAGRAGQDGPFDDYFVASAPRVEPAAAQRISDANRIAAGHAATHGRPPSSGRRDHGRGARPGGSQLRLGLVVALVIVVALAAFVAHVRGGHAVAVGSGDGVFGTVTVQPPEHDFPAPVRILPAPVVTGAGGYTVLEQRGGAPVTWDPCRPIHFVVRPDGQIPGGALALQRAIDEVSKETGLFFVDDGTTTEAPSTSRDPYQPGRYGKAWAPVLIAWSTPTEYPGLAGNIVGLAGPLTTEGKGARIVSGEVVLDAPELAEIQSRPQGATFVYDVLLHELGHLVGLGHVDDPTQIMNPVSLRPLGRFGDGDLRGLARVGAGRCFTKG